MKTIFTLGEKYFESGNILVILIILVLSILFNFNKIYCFFRDLKKEKVKNLSEALNCSELDPVTKTFLEDQRIKEHFKIATGIEAEKQFRTAIIETHNNTNGELSFTHFKRAKQYLLYTNSELSVKISRLDHAAYWFNIFVIVVTGIIGVFMFSLLGISKSVLLSTSTNYFALGTTYVSLSIFFIFQTFPVISAKYVRKEIVKQKNNT